MKTIAVTIDELTLMRVDRLMTKNTLPWKSRSAIIREAIQRLINSLERATEEEREREIFRRNRVRLNRQAVTLMKEQAKQ